MSLPLTSASPLPVPLPVPDRAAILGDSNPDVISQSRIQGITREGKLPFTDEMLRNAPSGDLFGWTLNAAMGWHPEEVNRSQFLILSTAGGLRAEDGAPIALGYHTGHWEIGLLVRQAAETFRAQNTIPFAGYVSDPCDGRTQGTVGMFDSLPYRNDAAITLRRLARSLPTRDGVMGIATCDKGLPAMMMALAGLRGLPGIIVPGGVTLPAPDSEDTGTVQSIGARYANDLISLDYASEMGCRACGSSGGGCQFLGTAATSQVVGEALGLSLPHSALAPSGEPVWLDMAHRSALALIALAAQKIHLTQIITQHAIENAMIVHAAFGGSTNLLLHIPAIAHAAGLRSPSVEDWRAVNRTVPRLVDALPNGPRNHPTVQVFMAGGVPEVMLHLRALGLLNLDAMTVSGMTVDENLNWWQDSPRRIQGRARLASAGEVNPDHVILSPEQAKQAGMTNTLIFPSGNIAPNGAVIKSTAIDPAVVDTDGIYRHKGRAKVFTTEKEAVRALKGQSERTIERGEVLVLIGIGPLGTGMEEIYQVTSALKFLPWGRTIPVITDGRFSGVSTGACIGHIGPEALAGGTIGKLRDGDLIEIVIDRVRMQGWLNFLGADGQEEDIITAHRTLSGRGLHPQIKADDRLPDDTRLWAALQDVSGGTWVGCVYDPELINLVLQAGIDAIARGTFDPSQV